MPKISDLSQLDMPSILLCGPPRTGKTLFALTAGESCELISTDGGWESAATFKDLWTSERQKVEVTVCEEDNPSFPRGFAKLRSLITQRYVQYQQDSYPYKVLVIDNLSSMAEMALAHMMTGSKRGIADNKGDINPASMREYGMAIGEITKLCSYLRLMKKVVRILITHTSIKDIVNDKNEIVGNREEIGVYGRNLPKDLTQWFSEVWYAKIQMAPRSKPTDPGSSFHIQTVPLPHLVCGTRAQVPNMLNMNVGLKKILKDHFRVDLP